ncbi:UPF0481 protein At3g47200-like [Trifolium pratense]|uniref:UPF0481 protein At3g47200-like n=1 Tax=Trifolium pratense TaxID=57577 RepID=UPI001E696776|nr:UPF0481 protein At3g47200-like [Trifolium pratense]
MEARPNGYVSVLENELVEMLKGAVLPEMSRTSEQCIYKVPQIIRQANPQAYTPQIISIGPFHNPRGSISANNNLHEMEELKLNYLKGFLNRTKLCVDDLVLKVQKLENKIRNCYAGLVCFDSNDFLKIIVVDACFIIELFLRYAFYPDWKEKDPILSKQWLHNDIKRDLILLENQLPFFVLEEIYKLANINLEVPSFVTITIWYFHRLNQQNINSERLCPKHFTDLLRTFLLPPSFDFAKEMENAGYAIQHVYSASQLSEAGLKFELSESKCLLDLKFDKGVLQMPCFHVHDSTEMHMRNIIAFEGCHISNYDSAYVSQYLSILDFLINTEKDVSILVNKKIISNWMGDANAVATMVNKLCKNVPMPKLNSKYLSLCNRLNGFYENPRNKYKAIFVHEYFNTPCKIASTVTALFLLLFTLIQAVCSIWSLLK